jgi:RNA polymerase sigma-70 factor (ECF subfamily)
MNGNLQDLQDNELLLLLKRGKGEAFRVLYNRYWKKLYAHAFRVSKDEELSKDVVQDVFVQLWDKAADLEINTSLGAYLYAAARNKILNLLTREDVKKKYLVTLADLLKNGEDKTDHRARENQLAGLIESQVSALPEKMQQVYRLSRHQQLSNHQIAANLGISSETVKKQISNAVKILRLKLNR